MASLASILAGIPDQIANGMDTAGRDLLGGYARAMNPAIMNEPLGAWQRIGALGMGAPAGALSERLVAPALAKVLSGAGMGSDYARLLNQAGVVVDQLAPQQNDPSAAAFARNRQWAKPADSYQTTLAPAQESQFQSWVHQNQVPFSPSPTADYDMRGFWQGLQNGDPHAITGTNPNDQQLHFSDWWKTPYHQSFSNESQWAQPNAPRWNDKDQLIGLDGSVVFDERAQRPSQGLTHDPYTGAIVDPQGNRWY